MSHALVVKAANLIRAGDIAGAEFALVSLAESDGDHALVAVLEEMPPKDLLAVIREFDASHESVVSLLVTPEQFARALVMERMYGDHTHAHLRGMVNAVLFRDDNQTEEFLTAIGELDGGCEALVDYLSDRDEAVVHFANYGTFFHLHTEAGDEIEKFEASDHDWKEVTWLLKHDHPDMFEQILPQLKTHLKQRLEAEAELEQQELAPDAPPTRPASPAAIIGKKSSSDPSEESAL
jgi:hypothetical protein